MEPLTGIGDFIMKKNESRNEQTDRLKGRVLARVHATDLALVTAGGVHCTISNDNGTEDEFVSDPTWALRDS
jgi:hypothetical protein